MPHIYEKLVDNSLAGVLSAIEIYNKPDFKYREEIFSILMINGWELLLKAKILRDAQDDIKSLYVSDNKGGYKQTRNGTPLTVEINGAINRIGLSPVVASNIRVLVGIRDSVIHLYHDQSLSYLLYTLGVASLQNYQKLISSWFDKNLLEYNFYILPLSFVYNFKTLSLLELEKEPDVISNLIRTVLDIQEAADPSDDFYFVCEIVTQIKKKVQFTTEPDLAVGIDPSVKDVVMIERSRSLIEQYPYSYTQLREKVKRERPSVKQTEIDKIIKEYQIKEDANMSAYNFRTKAQKDDYELKGILPKGITNIYNDNAIRFIVATLSKS